MKYSTVIVAACVGGASLVSPTHLDPHSRRQSPKNRILNTKQTVQRVGHNGNRLEADTWSNTQSSVGEPTVVQRNGDELHRLRENKGPNRLPPQYDETVPGGAHEIKSSTTHAAKGTMERTALVETGSQNDAGNSAHPSLPPLHSPVRRDFNNELDVEARDLDIEDFETRSYHDDAGLFGRGFLDDVKSNYHNRKAEDYKKKAAAEMALAGAQNHPPSEGELEARDLTDSRAGQVDARGYDAELGASGFVQSLNAAADTIFGKPAPSTPVVTRDTLNPLDRGLDARGYDDTKLLARGLVNAVGAIVDTFKGKKLASSASSVPSTDSSMSAESNPDENASMVARDVDEYLESRDFDNMELFERDIREELAARGYDDADLEARNLIDGFKRLLFGEKSAPSVHRESMVTPSYHPSMVTDPYTNENANVHVAQRDLVDEEYLHPRDFEEEMELFERDLAEELDAREYEDELEARDFDIDELD
ncbi:hypothetical protein C0989_010190 [Termitomyces sp. Mn162]|nr:hypothetical protein C0989_010190 [Termitomyces sp. Mn162]